MPSTSGTVGRPENAKTGHSEISLACPIGKSYRFAGYGVVVQEIFRAQTDPKIRYGCIAHDLIYYSG
jgi:hypothetical protein